MSEKRFQKTRIVDKWGGIYDSETDKVLNVNDVEHKLNEQQATINRLQSDLKDYNEIKENWNDMVELATKTSLRNVELDEQIGQLQQGIRIAYEKKPYPTFEDIQNEINNDIMMSEDIHKWTDGRYTLMFDEHTFFVWDNKKEERMTALEVTKKLNELSEENEQLRKELNDCEKFRYQVFKRMGELNDV